MKNIDEYHPNIAGQFLIQQHTIGTLRSETDLDNAKYHSIQTLDFIEDFLININGTNEEKINFISKIKEEIPKFYGKEQNQ